MKRIQFNTQEPLGEGRYGSVFKGTLDPLDYDHQVALVAVKRVELIDITVTENEENVLRQLDHPNVVKLFAVEKDSNFKYFALELCQASLDRLFLPIEDGRRYNGPKLPGPFTVLLQLATGLEYIHMNNFIHRDIKPQNVLISAAPSADAGHPKVTMKWADFGLSKRVSERGTYSMSNAIRGTENWLAPELLKQLSDPLERRRGTVSSDVFAEGLLFGYFLLSGMHPFGTSTEIPINIMRNNPVIMASNMAIQHINLKNIILKMLIPDPLSRITSSAVVQLLKDEILLNETNLFSKLTRTQPNISEIEMLLREGININCVNQNGLTLLLQLAIYHIRNGNAHFVDIVQLLAQYGIDVNGRDIYGWNVLHFFCRYYQHDNLIDIIKLFIRHNIDINLQETNGWNILHLLCRYYQKDKLLEIVDLLTYKGINVNCTGKDGWNAFHFLCRNYRNGNLIKIVELLIQRGVNVHYLQKDGWNGLHFLCRNYEEENLIDLVRLLVFHGIDIASYSCDASTLLRENYRKRNLNDIVNICRQN